MGRQPRPLALGVLLLLAHGVAAQMMPTVAQNAASPGAGGGEISPVYGQGARLTSAVLNSELALAAGIASQPVAGSTVSQPVGASGTSTQNVRDESPQDNKVYDCNQLGVQEPLFTIT